MKTKEMIGKRVVVRADRAGVFYGTLEEKNGDEVVLTNARKLHYWDGAGAVEELALSGTSKPDKCRFTVFVESICIMQVIQILPATNKSQKSIEAVPEWRA